MARLPLDKSLMVNFGILDIHYGSDDFKRFINSYPQEELGEDVKAIRDVVNTWYESPYVPVRNCRNLLIKLKVLCEKQGIEPIFLLGDQLRKRKLDPNSSQWKSGHILVGDRYDKKNMTYHNNLAEEAINLYNDGNLLQFDRTIDKQFNFYIQRLQGEDVTLDIESAEDVPLAFAFDQITLEEAEKQYPSLRHHETDRIKEMKYMLSDSVLASKDHRIIMARVMKKSMNDYISKGFSHVVYENEVNKSFPMFWEYFKEINEIYRDHS